MADIPLTGVQFCDTIDAEDTCNIRSEGFCYVREGQRMKTRLPILLLLALSFLLLFSAAEASTLTLPSGMMSIGSQAFMDDTSLDQVVLPEGLKKIYAKAFANSTVKKINLPSSLISIADDVFEGCENVYVTAKKGTYAYNWAVNRFYLPQISAGPDHTTIGEGQNCYLSISATGADLTYMWPHGVMPQCFPERAEILRLSAKFRAAGTATASAAP